MYVRHKVSGIFNFNIYLIHLGLIFVIQSWVPLQVPGSYVNFVSFPFGWFIALELDANWLKVICSNWLLLLLLLLLSFNHKTFIYFYFSWNCRSIIVTLWNCMIHFLNYWMKKKWNKQKKEQTLMFMHFEWIGTVLDTVIAIFMLFIIKHPSLKYDAKINKQWIK